MTGESASRAAEFGGVLIDGSTARVAGTAATSTNESATRVAGTGDGMTGGSIGVAGSGGVDTDQSAVLALLRTQMAAWAAGDGAAFAATFTDDADFVSVIGEFIRGRAELATVMQEGFDGFMKGTRMAEPDTITIRFPVPDTAVLCAVGDRPMPPGQSAPPESRSVQTRVAVRTAGAWLFTTFQNTRISQFPPGD
jgi:uncharacterized protein (TIGR02246 family)